MNQFSPVVAGPAEFTGAPVSAPFFIRGKLVEGADARHRSRDLGVDFATPALDLDAIVTPRTEPGPLFDVKLSEILDFLQETGEKMRRDEHGHLARCVDQMCATNVLPRGLIEMMMHHAAAYLNRDRLREYAERNLGDVRLLDGWVQSIDSAGRRSHTRAFPPRLAHVLPGNSPVAAVQSIALGAMVKAVNLFKMGSSDPFMGVAMLRAMLEVDPNHPVPRSMSCVYWRGGDERVESVLYRPQYFDKIVAWGGGDAIQNVIKYLMPGLQLVSFDPKTSISMVGVEAHATEATLDAAAKAAATDVGMGNQEVCTASRFVFMEGTREQGRRFCEKVQAELAAASEAGGKAPPLPRDTAEEIEALEMVDDDVDVWGAPDGRGLVILSDEPVDFHPTNKTANVVRVAALSDAFGHVNVATQTVGVYPPERMAALRDGLASGGAQRVVRLGEAGHQSIGAPHDAMFIMHRLVHWIVNEDGCETPAQAQH